MIRFATARPAVIWAMCVALLLAGAIAFTRLPLAARTTVELPRLSVAASWPGVAPEVIEAYLTAPIEAAIQGVRGVRRVSSISSDGLATLTVDLEERADVQMTRLAILERLELLRTEFPPGVSPPFVSNHVPEGFEELPLLSLMVFGPYTPGTLQRLLNEQVSPKLSGVPGVAGVTVRGGTDLGVSVTYDATRLRQLAIPPERLRETLASARLVQSLGMLTANAGTSAASVRAVVLRDQPDAIEALQALPVIGAAGRVFPLGELASIRAEEDTRGRFFRINGEPAVALDVVRSPGADAIKTAAALREAVAALRPSLPLGVRLEIANDESVDLARELRDLTMRGGIAFVAVLLVLLLFLRRWRAVAAVMGTTAVAIAATALTLYVFHVPANLLTLAGLCMGIGILVQNAIVVVERLAQAPDTAEGRAEATRRIAPAVMGSTLTTAVVLFPFLYLQGNARAAFVPFAVAFVVALAWSVFTSLLVVPALGTGVAARGVRWPRMRRVYAWMVRGTLRWRYVTFLLTLGALGGLIWVFVEKIPRSSFSWFGERRTTLRVSMTFPRGSDPGTLDQAMRDFETIAVGPREVEQVRTESRSPTSASMIVLFTRAGGWTSMPLIMQEQLTQRAVLVGGASISVVGDGPAFSSGGGGGGFSSFRLQVKGFAYDGVSRVAEDLKARLERVPRVRDVRITSGGWGWSELSYQVTLEPDRAALRRYGISAAQFTQAVAREVRGPIGAQRLVIGGDELPISLKAAGARERSLDQLQSAQLPSESGAPVRIGDVSVVAEQEALATVVREDQQYVRQVSYDFRGPPRLARRTHDAFVKSLLAPAGYSIIDQSSGMPFSQDDSQKGLWLVFGIGVVLVVLAVALVFDSVWGAAQVFLALPLALAGVIAAFWAADAAFTREAAVGVILVVGLAVNQAILLVDAALERRRMIGPLHAGLVLRAALDRAGMIMIVTVAALASLVPLSVGTGADTLFGAIALATAGGTLAGTVGAMFVMPALLMRAPGRGRRRRPRRPRSSLPVTAALLMLAFLLVGSAGDLDAQQTDPPRAERRPSSWRRSVEASGSLLYGAASQRVLNGQFSVGSETVHRQLRADVQSGYGDAIDLGTGERRVIVRNTRGTFSVDLTPRARVSPFAFGLAETSLQQRLASRMSAGAGAKYTAWRPDSVRGGFQEDASVSLAVLSERTRGLVVDTASVERGSGMRHRWSLRMRYRTRIGESLRFSHLTFFQPTFDRLARHTLESSTTLAVPLRSAIELTVTHRERVDSEARDRGAPSNRDGQILFGVRAAF